MNSLKLRCLDWCHYSTGVSSVWTSATHLGMFTVRESDSGMIYTISNEDYTYPVHFRSESEAKTEVERMILSWITDMLEA